jgi:hypothetical protein
MAWLQILLGAVLLLAGWRMFWLFVAAMGFIVAAAAASRLFVNQSDGLVLTIALAFGLIGAVLAQSLQRVAVAIAGFIAGAYVLNTLFAFIPGSATINVWLIYGIGGVVGAVLAAFLFDWALIFLSSLSGAALIVDHLQFNSAALVYLYFFLVLLGVIMQAALLAKSRRDHSLPKGS